MKSLNKILFLFLISCFVISCSEDDDAISVPQPEGSQIAPNVGGATEPNQIWVNLNDGTSASNLRTDWDFGFYANDDAFLVILNNACMMATKELDTNNIDEVTASSVAAFQSQVAVGTFADSNYQYADDVKGNFPSDRTAIAQVSANDADNKVYLVNMGYNIFTGTPATGAVTTIGTARGWRKIRVLRNGTNGYTLQYAELNSTTHQEVNITKDSQYNYQFLSIISGTASQVSIQPTKTNWDLCFTVFTNYIEGNGTYIYADFVTNNIMGGTYAYQVMTTEHTYEEFTQSMVDATKFETTDQRTIGANWRNTVPTSGSGPVVYQDRFYVVKDASGIYYKLRFLSMVETTGERGYPQFEYDFL